MVHPLPHLRQHQAGLLLRAPRSVPSTTRFSTSTSKTIVSTLPGQNILQVLTKCIADGQVVLGPESSSGYFTISGGTILLNGASRLYLNEDATATTSYKALTFNSTAITTDWQLEGDTIITTSPRELNFLACATSDPNYYSVFLQTGNDQPTGQSCSMCQTCPDRVTNEEGGASRNMP